MQFDSEYDFVIAEFNHSLDQRYAFLVTNVWRELEGQQIGWLERFSLLLGTTGSRNESEHRFKVLPDFYADGHGPEPLAA